MKMKEFSVSKFSVSTMVCLGLLVTGPALAGSPGQAKPVDMDQPAQEVDRPEQDLDRPAQDLEQEDVSQQDQTDQGEVSEDVDQVAQDQADQGEVAEDVDQVAQGQVDQGEVAEDVDQVAQGQVDQGEVAEDVDQAAQDQAEQDMADQVDVGQDDQVVELRDFVQGAEESKDQVEQELVDQRPESQVEQEQGAQIEQEQVDQIEQEIAEEGKDTVSVVDKILMDDRFTILVEVLQAAELEGLLREEGPYTIFAPTNAAFEALGLETLETLLEDKELLRDILLYHVISGTEVRSDEAMLLTTALMANGQDIMIDVSKDSLLVNDSKVIEADITVDNGVIHVIDTVLLP
ncbi:MAG: fasciclin domain-containing protein [Oligoflexus sp.]